MSLSELDTGDILLFQGNALVSRFLEYFGRSKYSHVAMVLKNPRYIRPDLPDGLYVLEASSNDAPDVEHLLGSSESFGGARVALHRLEDVLALYPSGSVFLRHVSCTRDETFYQRLAAAHEEVHHKPYDLNPVDWIRAEWNLIHPLAIHPDYQKTDAFWCSALLCYLFHRLDLLEHEVDWSLIAPREFSAQEGTRLRFRCPVSEEVPFSFPPPSEPSEPSESLGAPSEPLGAPSEPSESLGAPSEPSESLGAPSEPSEPSESLGAPSEPLGAPSEPSEA